jgi:hypothetical protein
MEQSRSERRHGGSSARPIGIGMTSVALLAGGIAVGLGGLSLGAYLASGNHGWTSSLLYSVVGLIGAPMAALSWASRRNLRCQLLAAAALGLGLLASMALLLELTHEMSEILHAWSQVPLAVAAWLLLWISWLVCALGRLIWFEPPRTRGRLSSRRGDHGR